MAGQMRVCVVRSKWEITALRIKWDGWENRSCRRMEQRNPRTTQRRTSELRSAHYQTATTIWKWLVGVMESSDRAQWLLEECPSP